MCELDVPLARCSKTAADDPPVCPVRPWEPAPGSTSLKHIRELTLVSPIALLRIGDWRFA